MRRCSGEQRAWAMLVTVINDKWEEGMASSIRLGVGALKLCARDAEGVVLMTCDQPAVTVKHLLHLMLRVEVKASSICGEEWDSCFLSG